MLPDQSIKHFQDAVCARAAGQDGARDRLSASINAVVADARREDMGAAKLVIAVKRAWDELTARGALQHDSETQRLRDNVISAAIREYYL